VLIKGSARAYTTMLNQLRADAYDVLAENWTETGVPTKEEGKRIANHINAWTGRGQIKSEKVKFAQKADAFAGGLTPLFFAPRFILSRFQSALGIARLGGEELYHKTRVAAGKVVGDPYTDELARTRHGLLAEYGRAAATFTTLAMLYSLFQGRDDDDDKMETNWLSNAFLRFKFGNTAVDLSGGLAGIVTLMGKFATGREKNFAGKMEDLGRVDHQGESTENGRGTLLLRWVRGKLSPGASLLVDALDPMGRDVIGRPVTFSGQLAESFMPIVWSEVADAYKTNGPLGGTLTAAAAIFGLGVRNSIEELSEEVPPEDKNVLYEHGVEIPRISYDSKVERIAGKRIKKGAVGTPITEEQRKELFQATTEDVQKAVKEAIAELRKLPADVDDYDDDVIEIGKDLADEVEGIREDAMRKILGR